MPNPQDPDAFEDHYEHRHLPLAAEKMPGVRGARTFRVCEVLADLPNFATGGAAALLCDDDEPTEA